MKYPHFLKRGNTIGVCAPSFGVSENPYRIRYDRSKEYLARCGYKIKESKSVYLLNKDESTTAVNRSREFLDLYFNNSVDFIMSVAGGEMMCEILPYIDFDKIKNSQPKFFMGYSDNTILTFTLTTICDIATIYGPCACDFGSSRLDKSFLNTLEIIKGNIIPQHSFRMYEVESKKYENYLAPLNKTKKVKWYCKDNDIKITGRLIGGCLDVLTMFLGTKYDKVKEFNQRYKEDGIIWYLETCDLHSIATKRALFCLKEAGWFENVRGFIFGRPNNTNTPFDVSYKEAVYKHLESYGVPIIFDVDIGHVHPSFTIINGCIATIYYKDNKGIVEQYLK
ncbi:MAG: LD-carboxypeptidase [Bacilli bacterium]|nr:LD-carboxypeptidase [Bacilli bacterium]